MIEALWDRIRIRIRIRDRDRDRDWTGLGADPRPEWRAALVEPIGAYGLD